MNDVYDIAVIGLGPAGSTFCRLVSDKYTIAAIDPKNNTPNSFMKPCGGLLSSDAQKAFACFDMTFPKEIIVDPQIFTVKTIDVKTGLIRNYQRFYINFDRHKFDMWLKSLIPENVNVFDESCMSIEKEFDCYKVSYRNNQGEIHSIKAKYLIGADGAKSIVRNTFFPEYKFRKYVAIQQWFEECHPNPFYSCIFDAETSDCCSWSVSKDNSFIFGGAFKQKDCRKMFELQKDRLKRYGFKFGTPIKTEACLVMRPKSISNFCSGRNDIFLLGEAAGLVSPSSLEGISSAIISAKKLSDVFNSGATDKNKLYRLKIMPQILKLFFKLFKCHFMYNPFLRMLVMKSGLNSIKVIEK